jgi:hypothetical protein
MTHDHGISYPLCAEGAATRVVVCGSNVTYTNTGAAVVEQQDLACFRTWA